MTSLTGTFHGCRSLTDITIPSTVTSLGETFRDCTSLTNITIPNSVTGLSSTFQGCTSLTSITIPDSITCIKGAFDECTNLSEVYFLNKNDWKLTGRWGARAVVSGTDFENPSKVAVYLKDTYKDMSWYRSDKYRE